MNKTKWVLVTCFLMVAAVVFSQTEVDERAMIHFDKGLGFSAPDTSFGLNLRFRIQNRMGFQTVSTDDLNVDEVEARIRRLRLRLDGYIRNENLTYYLQLSFSRSDQDWDASKVPNIIRDAMVYYRFSPKFYIGFGQGKLPGNRQRIISSGQLQFADRSMVNAQFNIDRDFGMMFYFSDALAGIQYNLKGAISNGEGRNALATDNGLAYTGRLELMPLGRFLNDGDFSEGDLEFEPTPKISLASGYSFNNKAIRRAGQRGGALFEARDLKNFYADVLFKYMGWAGYGEFIRRTTDDPFTYSGEEMSYVFTGEGINMQVSYCFRNFWELATRASFITPYDEISQFEPERKEYTLGVTKYLCRHKMKLQSNFSLVEQGEVSGLKDKWSYFIVLFQVELGI
jgi:phosphate-selective porin OprO and OprP